MKVFKKELPSWNEILKIDESSIEMQTESKDGRIFGSFKSTLQDAGYKDFEHCIKSLRKRGILGTEI
jgi:hypothetical protein